MGLKCKYNEAIECDYCELISPNNKLGSDICINCLFIHFINYSAILDKVLPENTLLPIKLIIVGMYKLWLIDNIHDSETRNRMLSLIEGSDEYATRMINSLIDYRKPHYIS